MNMIRDFTSVASEQVSLGSIAEVRRMVREADQPELMAAYQRVEELEQMLARIRKALTAEATSPFWTITAQDIVDEIDDALDPYQVPS